MIFSLPARALLAVVFLWLASGSPALRAGTELLDNPGFELGLDGWEASAEDAAQGLSKAAPEAAHTGKMGLHVAQTGAVKTAGSSLGSRWLAAQPGDAFQVDFQARCLDESGVGVFLQFYDARKQLLTVPPRQFFVAIPATAKDWTAFQVKGTAPDGAAFANVWIHAWSNAKCNADFDDFALTKSVPDKSAARVPAERIKAIAAMLAATPRGVGQPITDRAAWERVAAANPGLRAAAVANAERLLPQMDGPLVADQSQASHEAAYAGFEQRRYALVVLTQAECLEDKGRFLPAIERDLRSLCSERTWVAAFHDVKLTNFNGITREIDLLAGMTVWNVATADWLLGDRLQPATRQLLRAEAQRRVFAPFLAQARGQEKQEWWSVSPFNWNAVVHSGIVGAATALIDDPAVRAEIVAYAEQNVRLYLTGFKPDGYTGEGLGYWNYGFGHYTLMAETLLAATGGGINLYADERARIVAQMPRKIEILPGVYPAFSDALVTDRAALWALNILDHRYGFGWRVPPAERAISPQYSASLYALAVNEFFDPAAPVVFGGKADPAPGYHTRDWLPDAQVYVGRPAARDGDGLGLIFKGGVNNEPHGHLDLGTFVVAVGRDSVLVDPGAPVYTHETFGPNGGSVPLRNSHDHDVPVVAGQLQLPGAAHRSAVLATSFTDALDSVTLDLAKGYDVPALKRLTRRYDYDRAHRGAVAITDSAEFQTPQTFGTALVTLGQFKQLKSDLFLVYQHHVALQVAIDTGGVPFTTKDEPITGEMKSGHSKPRRLGIDLTNPAVSSRITLRIMPAPPVNPDPSLVPAETLARLQPADARALTVKAADFVRQSGGTAVPAMGMGTAGGALRSWKEAGHALTWKFHVTTAGTYGLQVRQCSAEDDDAGCTVQIDGATMPGGDGPFYLPPTDGWSNEGDDWQVTWLARGGKLFMCPLAPGDHEVTLTNASGQAVLDWVRLIPFDTPTAR